MAKPAIEIEIASRTVRVSNPGKVFFSARGETELDLVNDYLAVSDGALRGVFERPTVLERVPEKRPQWLETVRVTLPSGRPADERCPVAPLLELAAHDERSEGLGDEACPPNLPKAKGEPKRVAPSRARKKTP